MKLHRFLILALLVYQASHAQPTESAPSLKFLPPGLHFAPLKADNQEPRIGVFKFLDAGEMKVDIGNSIDLLGLDFSQSQITIGIDFFGNALVTGSEGLRLQLDALDGYFGGNVSFSEKL